MSTPTTINDGGEAFPSNRHHHLHRPRMSLRAYFAGQAMQSILQATISADLHASAQTPPDDVIVKWAVSVADALIAELNKTQ